MATLTDAVNELSITVTRLHERVGNLKATNIIEHKEIKDLLVIQNGRVRKNELAISKMLGYVLGVSGAVSLILGIIGLVLKQFNG